MSLTAHDQDANSADSEFVTNWKVVAVFVGLTVLPLCGAASWIVVMWTTDRDEPSMARHSPDPRTSGRKPPNDFADDRNAETAEVDQSTLVPWRPLAASSSITLAKDDLGNPSLETDDQPLVPAVTSEIEAAQKAATAKAESVFDAYSDQYEWKMLSDLKKHSIELDFEAVKGSTAKALAASQSSSDEEFRSSLLAKRTDLRGIPFRERADCEKKPDDAKRVQELSTLIGRVFATARSRGSSESGSEYEIFEAETKVYKLLESSERWRRPEYVSTLVQMLQVESYPMRLQLVELLGEIKSKEAAVALAERAIFDTSPDVRSAAVEALKKCSSGNYRSRLLEGFRYPWPAASVYAAQALVALDDQESVKSLVVLLDKPDPSVPFVDNKGNWSKRELVRVNHMRNCVLCHAPSRSGTDLVRGLVPTPGKPIPAAYYQSTRGSFVRADVTYLKQDFSVMQEVAEAHPWPTWQRFDYFVRQREATPEEIAAVETDSNNSPEAEESSPYLQREAVLMALRKLTGENPGDDSASWRALLASRSD